MTRVFAPPGLLCDRCGRALAFKQLSSGKWAPCDPDGSDHYDACKQVQRKAMGLINADGTVNWERLEALKPAGRSRMSKQITHVWSGEMPPWDESLGEYRNFTVAEMAAETICVPIER
jgi:hypothetical protein